MKNLLVGLAIISLIVACIASLIAFNHPKEQSFDLLTAEQIREQAYTQTDIAASEELLIKYTSNTPSYEFLHAFKNDHGGVWCGGSAQLLAGVYGSKGIEAYPYDYGWPGFFTHVVTLVRVDGELYLQDSYLNYGHTKPFFEVLKDLQNHKAPVLRHGKRMYRDVHVTQELKSTVWAFDREDPDVTCKPSGDHEVCRVVHSMDLLLRTYAKRPEVQQALDRLESLGYPRDLNYLMLFPLDVWGGKAAQKVEDEIRSFGAVAAME